jgi:hypothetical protein
VTASVQSLGRSLYPIARRMLIGLPVSTLGHSLPFKGEIDRAPRRCSRLRRRAAVASFRRRCPGRSDLEQLDVAAPVEPDRKCMGCLGTTNKRGLP